jgi:L-iditol 2-dehydrogenase
MIALRLHDKRDLRFHEEPVPTPGDDEVLVRVTAVGLCGSDLHWFHEGAIGDVVLKRPLVLGHEFVGVIETGARTGERVALDPAIACGGCAPCLAGHENLCVACSFAGNSIDGALRSRLAWPERLAHRVPDSLPDVEAALLEPLGVALHALDLGHVRPGTTAGVYGCGPLGLLLVQLLLRAGVTVLVATDPLPHRVAAAEALGATVAVETRRAGIEMLPAAVSGGVDVAFDVAGEDDAIATAIDTLRPGGRLVLVGIPTDDRSCFTASIARRKGLTISLCRRMKPSDLPRAIDLAEKGRIELGGLVSERYSLADGPEAFASLSERRGLKVVVEPQREDQRGAA